MKMLGKLSICACLAIAALNAENNATNSETSLVPNSQKTDGGGDTQKEEFKPIIVTAKSPEEVYQSGYKIGQKNIKNRPSGNGDIGTALRNVANVQFNTAQQSSNNPGEIDVANISISGGLYYQNNFTLNGFNINNDLFSNGEQSISQHNTTRWGTTASQGMAVDTSLLDSITVWDSNIPASVSGFTGGWVESKIRQPRTDGWHGKISYQHTSNHFTKYFIEEDQEDVFRRNTTEHYQPKFKKNIYNIALEGYITDNLGIVGNYKTTRSKIPVYAYSTTYENGSDAKKIQNQKRQIDSFFLQSFWTPIDNFLLETFVNYTPQKNTYFRGSTKDSFWTLDSGGLQLGTKAILESNIGKWTSQIGFSKLESTRDFERNVYKTWNVSEDKNWAYSSLTGSVAEGGFGLMEQKQKTFEIKSEIEFEPIDLANTAHKFSTGIEFGNQKITRKRGDYWQLSSSYMDNLNGNDCKIDEFGLESCASGNVLNPNKPWQGQYFTRLYRDAANSWTFDVQSFGAYLQDDIKLDLGNYGEFNFRPGVRFDKNNYMDDNPIAPRFAMNYVAPWGKENNFGSAITFGANRYYARNQYSYKLNSTLLTGWDYTYQRNAPDEPWSILDDVNDKHYVLFNKLKTSYSDELMFGIRQDLGIFNAEFKFIDRKNKKEVVSRQSNPPVPNEYSNYWTFTNDGESESKIYIFNIAQSNPVEFAGADHTISFAFDYTDTKRSHNPIFTFSENENKFIDNDYIMYNGKLIRFRDRPTENFATPWTARVTTTHEFNILGTDVVLSNFFRLRAGYDAMVRAGAAGTCSQGKYRGYSKAVADRYGEPCGPLFEYDTYEKMSFKKAFTWDARIGVEKKIYKENTLFVNLDIFNVLNRKNMTSRSTASGQSVYNSVSSASVPTYEIGRQFWLEVGYKF